MGKERFVLREQQRQKSPGRNELDMVGKENGSLDVGGEWETSGGASGG